MFYSYVPEGVELDRAEWLAKMQAVTPELIKEIFPEGVAGDEHP